MLCPTVMTHIVQATCLLALFDSPQILQDSPLDPTAVHAIAMQCTGVKGVYDVLQQLLSTSMWQHVPDFLDMLLAGFGDTDTEEYSEEGRLH